MPPAAYQQSAGFREDLEEEQILANPGLYVNGREGGPTHSPSTLRKSASLLAKAAKPTGGPRPSSSRLDSRRLVWLEA